MGGGQARSPTLTFAVTVNDVVVLLEKVMMSVWTATGAA